MFRIPSSEEYSEVLARPELRIRKGLRLQLLQLIKNHGHTVAPTRHLKLQLIPRTIVSWNARTLRVGTIW